MRQRNADRTTEPGPEPEALLPSARRGADRGAGRPVAAGGPDPAPAADAAAREQFHVDLRGIVDVLSHHLYSSPRVFLRELLQNATDALEARARLEPGFAGAVRVTSARGAEPLVVHDDGVGLTADEMRDLLATIGGSSKRGDFAGARRQLLGQFGIGLLSCFLVGDTVELRSRSAKDPHAPTIAWVGRSDGTFSISEASTPLEGPGTEVRVHPRPEGAGWCLAPTVHDLAAAFVEHLPVDVLVDDRLVSRVTPPWDLPVEDQLRWCRERLGFEPLGIVPLDSSLLDVRGIGFVLPYTAMPGHRTGDRLYSRGMLVADSDSHVLPGWAFFCRAVIDGGDLPLTASREAFQETGSLDIVRERLGKVLLGELIMVQGLRPDAYEAVMRLHADGLKALAAQGEDMRDLLRSTMPFRTTQGDRTLDALVAAGDPVPYVTDADLYAAMVDVAVHAGRLVLDASGPHDAAIVAALDPDGRVFRALGPADVVGIADPTPVEDAAGARRLVEVASAHLPGVAVEVASFRPETRPALWWPHEPAADGTTSGLVLNALHPAVARLLAVPDAVGAADALRALHVVAMLLGRADVGPERTGVLADAVGALVTAAVAGPATA
ncbi:ATP-binding protein [Phycicoccus sp. BSK3Z-2]|uniref:ATP-binding protein n=1 Tax=Phycicoccus avicenniae TaxID=2828860 RepID=A0A941HZ46_9MICO|nr:ATP-binding protein [Phycicoccus avicenniae]MBR7742567.1 ATP-binding protein [Phycicoccus avicenniae]